MLEHTQRKGNSWRHRERVSMNINLYIFIFYLCKITNRSVMDARNSWSGEYINLYIFILLSMQGNNKSVMDTRNSWNIPLLVFIMPASQMLSYETIMNVWNKKETNKQGLWREQLKTTMKQKSNIVKCSLIINKPFVYLWGNILINVTNWFIFNFETNSYNNWRNSFIAKEECTKCGQFGKHMEKNGKHKYSSQVENGEKCWKQLWREW